MADVHDGHRERMRERYIQNGLTGFAPHEVLELLLFFAIPRRNVNPLAHRLIEHFGTLDAVFEASYAQLLHVPGIGEKSALLLSMVLPMGRYAERARQTERAVITNHRTAKAYCRYLFDRQTDEVLYVISLDAQGRVIHASQAVVGTIDEMVIYPRKVVAEALMRNAHAVVLAHNHPSGVAEPSEADIRTTDALSGALGGVDIQLLDHIIYAEGTCTSLRQWREATRFSPMVALPDRRAADTKQARRTTKDEDD